MFANRRSQRIGIIGICLLALVLSVVWATVASAQTPPPALLKTLYLVNNRLTGSIPSELGNLSNLDFLGLAGNQLSGCIPAALRNVQDNNLSSLGLAFCSAG